LKYLDNQAILNYDKPKYIQPEPFHQINFDVKSEDITSEEVQKYFK